jgi:hypothetical protein
MDNIQFSFIKIILLDKRNILKEGAIDDAIIKEYLLFYVLRQTFIQIFNHQLQSVDIRYVNKKTLKIFIAKLMLHLDE